MARCVLSGAAVSPGIAIGPLRLMQSMRLFEKRAVAASEVSAELQKLDDACRATQDALAAAVDEIPQSLAEYREIMLAQLELARDPKILDACRAKIGARKICASWALAETMEELCALFAGLEDAYMRERAQDVRAVCRRLADALAGTEIPQDLAQEAILAAYEVSPADIMDLGPHGVCGLLTVEGGPASHTAILARSLNIPAITGLTELLPQGREGEIIIVDGLQGRVLLDPDASELKKYRKLQAEYQRFDEQARRTAHEEALTRDGLNLEVGANLENPSELGLLESSGAAGIGLYRTEYAYLDGPLPAEESLYREYSAVLRRAWPRRAIIRTLDIGSDKHLVPEELAKEKNPALGMRGIRFCLEHEDIFRAQLRAILRAAVHGDAAILLPMISRGDEAAKTREILRSVAKELEREGLPHKSALPLGIMIETPAAAMICDLLAAECDFISIGTNDLVHYVLAIDRGERRLAHLHDPFHPAVIRVLKNIIAAAHAKKLKVGVCGELASDPAGIALLLGLGVDSLSAAPRLVPGVKQVLRNLDAGECARDVNLILEDMDAEKIKNFRRKTLNAFAVRAAP